MNRFLFRIAVIFSAIMLTIPFTGCSDDDDNESTDNARRVTLSRKTDYGNDWIYFSLSQGKELTGINEDNRNENLTWDLAFNRYNVRTNSGLSGKGHGGAMDANTTDMAAVVAVPEGEFAVDEMGKITSRFTGSGVEEIESPLNQVLAKAIKFAGPPPSYTPNNHVYIVKTADGKYAKIKIEGFYNDEGQSGFLTFSYVYQPDGSKLF